MDTKSPPHTHTHTHTLSHLYSCILVSFIQHLLNEPQTGIHGRNEQRCAGQRSRVLLGTAVSVSTDPCLEEEGAVLGVLFCSIVHRCWSRWGQGEVIRSQGIVPWLLRRSKMEKFSQKIILGGGVQE